MQNSPKAYKGKLAKEPRQKVGGAKVCEDKRFRLVGAHTWDVCVVLGARSSSREGYNATWCISSSSDSRSLCFHKFMCRYHQALVRPLHRSLLCHLWLRSPKCWYKMVDIEVLLDGQFTSWWWISIQTSIIYEKYFLKSNCIDFFIEYVVNG